MLKIIYAATPSRMYNHKDEICNLIILNNCISIHPFLTLPLEIDYEKRYNREDIYRACFKLIDCSDELWIFGINNGSLKEYSYAKEQGKSTKSFVKLFDPIWKQQSLNEKYISYVKVIEEITKKEEILINS